MYEGTITIFGLHPLARDIDLGSASRIGTGTTLRPLL